MKVASGLIFSKAEKMETGEGRKRKCRLMRNQQIDRRFIDADFRDENLFRKAQQDPSI